MARFGLPLIRLLVSAASADTQSRSILKQFRLTHTQSPFVLNLTLVEDFNIVGNLHLAFPGYSHNLVDSLVEK
jgi:hypothetical protein